MSLSNDSRVEILLSRPLIGVANLVGFVCRSTFIVAITYRKLFKGALVERRAVERTSDPPGFLGGFHPLAMVQGFPPGERFAERQRRLEEALTLQFGTLTSAVLREFPEHVTR